MPTRRPSTLNYLSSVAHRVTHRVDRHHVLRLVNNNVEQKRHRHKSNPAKTGVMPS